jgi:hypothetical protein
LAMGSPSRSGCACGRVSVTATPHEVNLAGLSRPMPHVNPYLLLGMALIVAGVAVIQLFSRTAGH